MSGQQYGDCTVKRITDNPIQADRIVITQADPRIRVCADLLQEISILTCSGEDRYATLDGDVLTLHGSNRTVVYRVNWNDWDPSTDTYSAEWPD